MNIRAFIIIVMIATIGQFAAEIYLPSLPFIVKELSSKEETIQLTISFFMLGYCVSQLIYGPWSDRVGRRIPIFTGLGISLIGTAICIFATSDVQLIIGRIIQGIGIGTTNSVGRSLSRDLFSGEQLARISSYMSMLIAIAISIAPTLGGYIQYWLDWRASFIVVFALIALLMAFYGWWMPETNRHLDPNATKIKIIGKNFQRLVSNHSFLGYTLCSSFAYAGILGYLTAAPFIFESRFHLSAIEFGWLAFVVAGAILVGSYINAKLIHFIGIPRMILVGIIAMFISGIALLFIELSGFFSLFTLICTLTLFSAGCGFAFSNASAGALTPFPKLAGFAAAVYGFFQILGGTVASYTIALIPKHSPVEIAVLFITVGILSGLALKHALSANQNQNT